MRTELLRLDEEKKQLIEERERLMVKVRLNPGWGIDDEGYPDPNFPHIDQAHTRSRIGEIEVRLAIIAKQIDDKMMEYFGKNE